MEQRCLQAKGRVCRDSELAGDTITCLEAKASDDIGQCVGVLRDHLPGLWPQLLHHGVGLTRRQPGHALERHHHRMRAAETLPALSYLPGPHPADPGHLLQALAAFIEHLEGVGAEMLH